ncbi:MAG: DMT family transporter [Thermoflexales bacterium]|nr:DMT family transporter [Thermoflexales bacterium]MDW8053497.1 DMT family transporter [Anaerolineae bacterium]MDW8292207.1 DMT family transporter [Anaerolineae bacterium]
MPRQTLFANLAILGVAIIWGGTFPLVKDGAATVSAAGFVALRMGIAVLALLPLAWRGLRALPLRWVVYASLCGLVLGVGYVLQVAGLQLIAPGRAAFITGFYGPLTPVLAALVGRQALTKPTLLAMLLALLGLGGLFWEDLSFNVSFGDALVLLAAVAWAAQIVMVSFFRRDLDPAAMALVQSLACGLGAWAADSLSGAPTNVLALSGLTWFAAAFTGVFCTALAFAVQAWAQRHTPPAVAGLIFCTEPVWGMLAGALFSAETFTFTALVGSVLLLLGMMTPDAATLLAQRGQRVGRAQPKPCVACAAEQTVQRT